MLNKVTLIGHLGKDAELRFTGSGNPVVNFSMATNRKWKDSQSGELQEEVQWHKVVFWGKRAEAVSQYLTKGKLVAVEGRYTNRKYQDREGNDRYVSEVVCENVVLLGRDGPAEPRQQGTNDEQPYARPTEARPVAAPSDQYTEDDIPF